MEDIHVKHGEVALVSRGIPGSLFRDRLVMLFPDVLGVSNLQESRAVAIAQHLGCSVMVADMYGEAALPRAIRDNREAAIPKAMPLLNDLLGDPVKLRTRLTTVIAAGRIHFGATKVAAIGFCFGGTCALECVRSGVDLVSAISFHGGIEAKPIGGKPNEPPPAPKSSSPNNYNKDCAVLLMNGAIDPIVPLDVFTRFQQEMMEAQIKNWTVENYGNAKHAFTAAPNAPINPFGGFHESARRRSWIAAFDLLRETLGLMESDEVKWVLPKI